ncbi:MAG: ATP-binding protein [bacterium]|nr:ATP-binding protein [bacterium]
MTGLSAITLLVNGITLALALALLFIVLWSDGNRELNSFFTVFLLLVVVWNAGSLLWRAIQELQLETPLDGLAIGLTELGFTGASVAAYALAAALVRAHTRRFRVLAFVSIGVLVLYQILVFLLNSAVQYEMMPSDSAQRQPLGIAFYLIFDFGTLYLIWRNRRKIRSLGVMAGLTLFVMGQTLGFVNADLQAFDLALIVTSVGALIISFSIVSQEIIRPLAERNSQVEAIRRVSLAITSLASLDTLLMQIAAQTAALLKTDGGVSLMLIKDGALETATVHHLPRSYLSQRLPLGEGLAGTVARTRQSLMVDNYRRDWKGKEDYPLARDTFGSVICTPLVYGGETIGTLMVIAANHGVLFQKEDLYLLELLAAQAAVAISHSQLFSDVEFARSQLETVLSSTDSPVIALDRSFHLIFANGAARQLLKLPDHVQPDHPLRDMIPRSALPAFIGRALRELRRSGTLTYEVTFGNRIFLCNIACLGRPRLTGWVAVLNDVTQLKELDRLKSEMVRMTSHDLKNPLQVAMAYTDLLRDDLVGVVDESVSEAVDKLDWQLQRMNRIIRGILDLERVKSGKMRVETLAPVRLMEDAAHEMRQFAHSQGISLHLELDENVPMIRGDAEQLRRAVVNLIENAIKFTGRGGSVAVYMAAEQEQVKITVTDTGVGIDPEAQPRVFDRFYRAEQKGTEHIAGSGVGLSLVKAVVENHGGRIWFTSALGRGTTFYVEIPFTGNRLSYSQS